MLTRPPPAAAASASCVGGGFLLPAADSEMTRSASIVRIRRVCCVILVKGRNPSSSTAFLSVLDTSLMSLSEETGA